MKVYDTITADLQEWILQQKIFFVGTAPLQADGHVNLSPKGYDCLRIIDDTTVCYLDMTGSGNETSTHVTENGRITFMWCAMDGSPVILRLYGRGEVVLRQDTTRWDAFVRKHYPEGVLPSSRQIIVNHVDRVQTSCGYGVPFFDYREDRETLKKYFAVKEKQEGAMEKYWKEKNMKSIDGITSPYGPTSYLQSKIWRVPVVPGIDEPFPLAVDPIDAHTTAPAARTGRLDGSPRSRMFR